MDQTQAQFLTQYLCKLWEGEFPATVKVLAAVPDDKRTYRPDEKSRTAWELATHLATADIWFADSIVARSSPPRSTGFVRCPPTSWRPRWTSSA